MSSDKTCIMCGFTTIDDVNLGEMKTLDEISAHYYCLLLATTIQQSGEDNDGILGFLKSDIFQEVLRSKYRTCHYCTRKGAAISCSTKSCRITFHLPCGIKHETGHEFFDAFISSCHMHRPRQKYLVPTVPKNCPICYEPLNFKIWTNIIWAPCCKKNFFHKDCLQKLALNAGYFFKCPLCTDVQRFQKCVKKYGVFVPDCDASWETEAGAFQELYERHNECNVSCLCPKGNKYSGTGQWSISLCRTCGLQGGHYACIKSRNMDRGTFACDICKSIGTSNNNKSSTESNVENNENESSDTPSCSGAEYYGTNSNNVMKYYEDTDSQDETKEADQTSDQEDDVILIDSDDDDDDIQIVSSKNSKNIKSSPPNNLKHLMTQDGSLIPVRLITKDAVKSDLPITFIESASEAIESPPRKLMKVTRSRSQNTDLIESDTNEFGIKITDVRSLNDEFSEPVQLSVAVQESIDSSTIAAVYQNGLRSKSADDIIKSPANINGSIQYDRSAPKKFNSLSINGGTNSGTDLSDSDSDVVIVD